MGQIVSKNIKTAKLASAIPPTPASTPESPSVEESESESEEAPSEEPPQALSIIIAAKETIGSAIFFDREIPMVPFH
jgi:hypothetical protein